MSKTYMRQKMQESVLFLREALADFEKTGSIFPTSRWAAEALTVALIGPRTPQNIVELGPGNGSVTVKILELLQGGDRLTICEINPRFMDALKTRLEKLPSFQKHKEQITFFLGPAQDLPEDIQYNTIVCAIPFLNLELPIVKDIFVKIKRLAAPEAVLTYYEYIGIRPLSKVISPAARKRRMKELDGFFKELSNENTTNRKQVWLNLFPIHIYKVGFQKESDLNNVLHLNSHGSQRSVPQSRAHAG